MSSLEAHRNQSGQRLLLGGRMAGLGYDHLAVGHAAAEGTERAHGWQ